MSNPNDPQHHPDALNALENLASGKSPGPLSHEDNIDASGFVGMLARGNQSETDPAGPARPPATMRPMPTVSPRPIASAPPTPNQLSAAIPVAKEIVQPQPPAYQPAANAYVEPIIHDPTYEDPPAQPAPASSPRAAAPRARSRRRVPNWYHTAVPICFTLGGLLVLIGLWSLMAVLSKVTGSDMAPGYHITESIIMPAILLLSLPVGIVLEIMAVIMRKQLKWQAAADQAGR